MKTFKQLLWFLIPTVLFTALLCLSIVLPKSATPSFMGARNYWRLFLEDPLFLRALFHTVGGALLLTALSVAVLYIAKLAIQAAVKKPIGNRYLLPCVFAVGSLLFYGYIRWRTRVVLGVDAAAYAAGTIVSHIGDYGATPFRLHPPLLFLSLQVGLFFSFLIWLADKLVTRRRVRHITPNDS